MRVTGGELGGRRIRVPGGAVRPTQDRVREALFSSLGGRVAGARVLDLFAGTGALGIEAYSRGASTVTWVEQDPAVFRILRANVVNLCGDDPGLRVIRRDAYRFLRQDPIGPGFDLVLADPPYRGRGQGGGAGETLLPLLAAGRILEPAGCLVLEQGADEPVAEPAGWTLARDRAYGNTRLLMYTRGPAAPTGDHDP